MAQYIFTMNGLGKVVPPKKEILKDINLNFFPGAKIGVLGYNGAGKSTLLRIMAGVDTDFIGEARPASGIRIGYLPQEPELDPDKNVRANVEEGLSDIKQAHEALEAVYAAYAEPDADFDALATEQARLENIIQAADAHNLDRKLEVAADALRLEIRIVAISETEYAVPSLERCHGGKHRVSFRPVGVWHGMIVLADRVRHAGHST